MPDPEGQEGGNANENPSASKKGSRKQDAPSRATDQGTQTIPDCSQDILELRENPSGICQALLKAINAESSADVRKDLVAALAKITELEAHSEELSNARSAEYYLAELRAEEAMARDGRRELRNASRRDTAIRAVPVIFALGLGVMLFFFLKWQMKEAVSIVRDLLVLLFTGALGWAAGRKSAGNARENSTA